MEAFIFIVVDLLTMSWADSVTVLELFEVFQLLYPVRVIGWCFTVP